MHSAGKRIPALRTRGVDIVIEELAQAVGRSSQCLGNGAIYLAGASPDKCSVELNEKLDVPLGLPALEQVFSYLVQVLRLVDDIPFQNLGEQIGYLQVVQGLGSSEGMSFIDHRRLAGEDMGHHRSNVLHIYHGDARIPNPGLDHPSMPRTVDLEGEVLHEEVGPEESIGISGLDYFSLDFCVPATALHMRIERRTETGDFDDMGSGRRRAQQVSLQLDLAGMHRGEQQGFAHPFEGGFETGGILEITLEVFYPFRAIPLQPRPGPVPERGG